MNKFEGMASLADKAETERCLQRARDAGVPGLGPGAGSYFLERGSYLVVGEN